MMTDNDQRKFSPRVFISYAWTDPEYIKLITGIVERLIKDGIDVLFDQWELTPGKDLYHYIERAVTDKNVTKVLVFCNQTYKEKADGRTGGVGAETLIITPEVYKSVDSDKFIPVIMEFDEEGNPIMPAYLMSKIYVSLTQNRKDFEEQYEKLARLIWGEPVSVKPPLGEKPRWLDKKTNNLWGLESQILSYRREGLSPIKRKQIEGQFLSQLIEILEKHGQNYDDSPSKIYKCIEDSKEIRDRWLQFLDEIIQADQNDAGYRIGEYFDELLKFRFRAQRENLRIPDEAMEYFLWESVICCSGLMIYYECFSQLRKFLNHPYSEDISGNRNVGFLIFNSEFRNLEQYFKPTTEQPRLFSLAGETLLEKREYRPFLDKTSLINADMILFHLSDTVITSTTNWVWFPKLYVYGRRMMYWQKLYSKTFCEKVFPLFSVNSIDDLSEAISKKHVQFPIRYPTCFEEALRIIDVVDLKSIGKYD